MLLTSVNYGVASSSSWSKSMCYPETGITRIRGAQRLLPPWNCERLEQVRIGRSAPISIRIKPLSFLAFS